MNINCKVNELVEAPSGIVIDDIRFDRVILKISGHITEDVGVLKGAKIYLQDYLQGVFEPAHLELDKEKRTFFLRYHILGANKQYPFESGDYYLRLKVAGKKYYATVSEKLNYVNKNGRLVYPYSDDMDIRWIQDMPNDNNYSYWLKKSGNHYIYALSKLDLDSGFYYLKVDSAFPGEPLGIWKTWCKKLNKTKKTFKPIVEKFLKSIFNKFNMARKRSVEKSGYKKQILFASASRAEIGGNLEFIYNRMRQRGLDRNFRIQFNFKESINDRRGFFGAIKFTRQLASSDIILIDDFFPFVYRFDYAKDVKFIQVWHACGAFKSIGFEREGKPGAPAINTRTHKCYTHVPVSSEHVALHNAEGFGLTEDKFIPTGVPRTDIFFDDEYGKKIVDKIYNEYPVLRERKKVYLYAPTFRGSNARDAYFPFEQIDLQRWGEMCVKQNAHLLIKMHPFVTDRIVIPDKYKDYITDMSPYREVNDILFVTDVLITDYSSIIYEFSLLRRPMYFFAFDQRMYEESRDFYEPYEDIVPGRILKTFKQLMRELEKEEFDYESLDNFVRKNFKYRDGKATDRIIDDIILDD